MGQFTVNYVIGDETRVFEGVTKNGALCNTGESQSDCTARLLRKWVQEEIKNYEQNRDSQTAVDAVTDVTIT